MVAIGYLMVSTVEFFSIKQFKFSGVKLKARLTLGLLIALTWKSPQVGLLFLAGGYVLSGPFMRVRHKLPRLLGGNPMRSGHVDEKVVSIR
jgi:phosphatidylserine synthase